MSIYYKLFLRSRLQQQSEAREEEDEKGGGGGGQRGDRQRQREGGGRQREIFQRLQGEVELQVVAPLAQQLQVSRVELHRMADLEEGLRVATTPGT